jgi:hypothetical protein
MLSVVNTGELCVLNAGERCSLCVLNAGERRVW